jgi:hypothetical protein
MKTPEEIKKGLECCIGDCNEYRCQECPYRQENDDCPENGGKLCEDVIAYIRQLESELEAVRRERDAAVKDLLNASLYDYTLCKTCKKGKNGKCKPICTPRRDYEWRGVCPENTVVQDG